MAGEAGPEYQRLMRQIRARIISGEYLVGGPIPSTSALGAESGMSRPVVRRAIDQLEAEGILEGHQGKAVFVKAMPSVADRRRDDAEALAGQLAELRQAFRDLEGRTEGYEDLRAKVNRMEAVVINLCSRLNVEYPHGGARDITEKAPRRGRAG